MTAIQPKWRQLKYINYWYEREKNLKGNSRWCVCCSRHPGRNKNISSDINEQRRKRHTTIFFFLLLLILEPHTHTTWRQELAFITRLINFSYSNRLSLSRPSTTLISTWWWFSFLFSGGEWRDSSHLSYRSSKVFWPILSSSHFTNILLLVQVRSMT